MRALAHDMRHVGDVEADLQIGKPLEMAGSSAGLNAGAASHVPHNIHL
jgi:hypothetical protein